MNFKSILIAIAFTMAAMTSLPSCITAKVDDPQINFDLGQFGERYEERIFCMTVIFQYLNKAFVTPMAALYCATGVLGMDEDFAHCLICEVHPHAECTVISQNSCERALNIDQRDTIDCIRDAMSGQESIDACANLDFADPDIDGVIGECRRECAEDVYRQAQSCTQNRSYELCSAEAAILLRSCLTRCKE